MCNVLDWATKPGECAGQAASSALGDAIQNMANAVMEAFGKAVASLGTLWVNVGTPNLTRSGGSSSIAAGSSAPNSGNILAVLGYVTWVSFAVAAMALLLLGGVIATRVRRGEGFAAVGRLGLILAAVILISGSAGLVSGLLPRGPRGAGGAVLFLQSALWWYMGLGAVLSVIVGGVRMAWEQRAEPGRETLRSLLTLIVVAGAGVTMVGLLVAAADSFSVWLLNGSLRCDVAADSACFKSSMGKLLALTSGPATAAGGLGPLLIIILGLVAVLAAALQIMIMVARAGMLVILTGVLPLAASATNTEMGKQWFRKCLAWLVAFILYKPAAAIVYAAAFQLVGTNVVRDDGSGLLAVLSGLMLMIVALFAMPALMRLVTPMVGAMAAGGGAGALAGGALAALPTGAAAAGRLASGSAGGGSPVAGGPNGGGGGSSGGPSGSGQPQGATPSPGSSPSGTGNGGAPDGTRGVRAGGQPNPGAAATSASAGSSGAGAVSAAAGPVGMAGGVAVDVAKGMGSAALGAAHQVSEESTGEGGGPHGSR